MNLTYTADIKYARMVSDKCGLGLKIDAVNTQPRTDGRYIYLPPLDPLWSKSSPEYRDWWFSLLHESFHNIHSSDFDLIKDKKIDMRSFVGSVLNIVMDFKIETCNRGEFAGRDSLVHQARYAFAADKIYRHLGKSPPGDTLKPMLEAIWVLDALCRIPWIPEYKADDLAGRLSPDGLGHLETLLSSSTLFANYQGQKTSEDTYNVQQEILTLLEIDQDDPANNKSPEPVEVEDDPEGMGWTKFSAIVASDHGDSNREAGVHIEYDVTQDSDWVPMELEEKDLDKPFPEPVRDRALAAQFDDLFSQVHLSKKIRRELQSMARTRIVTQKRRGRVHKRALYKTAADSNAKVFKQRDVRFSPKSTAVMLLQDWSGSMGHTKFKNACVATHELGRVLQALQVPFGIYGFSTLSMVRNLLFKMKSFSETFRTDVYRDRCVNASHHMHSNADGDYILWAAEQLMKQKATRKILFVLSDGSPAAHDCHGSNNAMGFTQKVVKKIEAMGLIEIYAIGIMDRNVDLIYKHRCSIDRSDELESKLLSVLRNKILAGMTS